MSTNQVTSLDDTTKKFDPLKTLLTAFQKKINILILDDEPSIGEILADNVFTSPMFNIVHVQTFKDAVNEISSPKVPWHTWIVDFNLKEQNNGSNLLDKFPNYDYAIIFSGASTLETASNALKKGAIAAFSKEPAFFYNSDAFYNEVCRVAALSFILGGGHNAHKQVFGLLVSENITTIEDWAYKAHLSLRQIQRICELYVPFTPRMLLPLYHAFYYALRAPSFTENFDSETEEDIRIRNNRDFYMSCLDTVASKLDTVYISLLGKPV